MENSNNIDNKDTGIPKHKFSEYFYNPMTYVGVFIALLVFIIECFLFAMDFLSPHPSTYLGMFTYILLPPFLILGLILIPLGASWKRKDVKQGKVKIASKVFYFDPSLPEHRNALFVFVIGTSVLLLMTAVGSYKAFHFTESVEFCGKVCHKIMEPEHTMYLQSPHAKVKCVECHIGAGADWYVRYKVSGARMLLSTIQKNYQRPIPTPVMNLRPARETCEQCHWPGKHFSSFELRKTYFPTEKNESESWYIRMLVSVGGKEGEGAGIHAHMYKDNEVYYVADDDKRQVISWVKSVNKDGKEVVFTSDNSPYKDKVPPGDKIRKMDCMDCHNRPSHHFRSPNDLMNEALIQKQIDSTIPDIKSKSMELLSGHYETENQALLEIPQRLNQYYQKKYPDYFKDHQTEIITVGQVLTAIFRNNFFPEMKARWDAYPENIGHWISPGCFRCHDGEHKSTQGQIITRDCKSCHTILEQGAPGKTEKNADGLEFVHPFNGDESWKEMNCTDCHAGN
jgi:hypothetical protein